MSNAAKQLLEQALSLSEQEREELAMALLTSLGETNEVDQVHVAESQRRLAAYQNGELTVLSSEEAIGRIRE
jgi:putative addiction module component (TIGR02574 family)